MLPLPIPDVPGWIGLVTPFPEDNPAAATVPALPGSLPSVTALTGVTIAIIVKMVAIVE